MMEDMIRSIRYSDGMRSQAGKEESAEQRSAARIGSAGDSD